ncbi:MAG: PhnD/SsuA/transferrin family substrate-binding protein [Thiobacillus sp.]|nr:PhnD/SsuA/transferrin family substrate-binding protein [Thiobacillus sp.]
MRRRSFLLTAALWPLFGHAASRDLIFVVHPYDTPSRIYTRFRPLTLYLGGVLGRPVKLVIASTYDEQIAMIVDGRADFAYLGPTPYVQARNRAAIRILAGEAENGQAFYQSAIVTRVDSPIKTLADLKGKSVAFGASISMSSTVAPTLMLAQAGVELDDLAGHAQLDRHERVALAVLHGDFDAGGLRLDIAREYLPRGLKILNTSLPLPPHLIACSPHFPDSLEIRARQALLVPDDSGLRAFKSLGEAISFVPIEDSHYQSVRRMLREIAR